MTTHFEADDFRGRVRREAACPKCGAFKNQYCKEPDGSVRVPNHRERVELVVGYPLTEVNWRQQAIRRKSRTHRRKKRGWIEISSLDRF